MHWSLACSTYYIFMYERSFLRILEYVGTLVGKSYRCRVQCHFGEVVLARYCSWASRRAFFSSRRLCIQSTSEASCTIRKFFPRVFEDDFHIHYFPCSSNWKAEYRISLLHDSIMCVKVEQSMQWDS
mgnify:CR=1 FL=1